MDVEEHVWQLEEEKEVVTNDPAPPGNIGSGDDGDSSGRENNGSGGGGGGGGGGSSAVRGAEANSAVWQMSSGRALLSHLGLSSAVGPSPSR